MAAGPGQTLAPIISGVTITGDPGEYATLSVTVAQAVGYPTPVVALQWYDNDSPIPGATGVNYVVQPSDVGNVLTVVAVATNEEGSASATSNAVTIPVPAPVTTTPPPTTTTPPPSGSTVTVTTSNGTIDVTGQEALGAFDLSALATGGDAIDLGDTPEGINVQTAWDDLKSAVEDVFSGLSGDIEDIGASTLADGTWVVVPEVTTEVAFEIDALPAVGFAAALLASEYAFGWVVAKVAALIPDPSLFGWHPLGFIPDSMKKLGDGLKHDALYWSDRIVAVFRTPIQQLVALFQRLTNTLAGAHNKSAAIVNNNIPAAVQDAQDAAARYTAHEIALVDQATMTARDQIATVTTEGEARSLLDQSRQIGGINWDMIGLAAAAVIATDEYAKSLFNDGTSYTDATVAKAKADAQAALTSLQDQLVGRLTTDEAAIVGLDQAVTTTVSPAVASAIASAISADEAQTNATTQGLQAQLTALQNQLDALNSRVANDEATIAAANTEIQNITAAETIDTTALEEAQATIVSAQQDIAIANTQIGDLNTTITTIGDQLTAVQQATQANTAALAPVEPPVGLGLATVIATLTATVAKVATQVETCTVDNCDPTNPNNIRNVLRSLLGLFVATAEIGFIAEAIRDPLGTANALAPILDTIDTTANDTLTALLSL